LRDLLKPDAPGSRFRMPGFVSDTRPLLAESDALVITSDHEGIPMAALEALAAGIPVFAFRVGGMPEIGAPDLPLQLAPPGDTSALAGEIAHYFTHHAPGTRIAPPPGWSFDIRECARAYEHLYSSL
jgi:glycosyltransferase involved in cell wall biosynthesis